MNIPGLDPTRQKLINALALKQQRIVQPQMDYKQLILKLINEQRLKNISLQSKKSKAARQLTRKRFEFEKKTGQLSLRDIEKQATANMWNTIIAGFGSAAGNWLTNRAMQDYAWKNYLTYSGLGQPSNTPLEQLNPGIMPEWLTQKRWRP